MYHPLVSFAYFAAILAFSMIVMHPVCLAISAVCAFCYSVYLNGRKALKNALFFALPMLIFAALFNPLFNHQGNTILSYLPGGNPLTLESIIYGIAAAIMLVSVLTWFSCFNAVITSDKFVYLFGRLIPALSLVLSMVLRFVPTFIAQAKVIRNADFGIKAYQDKGIFSKAKRGIQHLSILITWALENAVETADSMKSRGYGLPKRTAFSNYRFERRDGIALAVIFACAAIVVAAVAVGRLNWRYFPTFRVTVDAVSIVIFGVYAVLCALPLLISLREVFYWNYSRLKT